ncbi:MAG: DedA family protein [Candidatus Kapabacteria bacterium]|nr:DedA family protein [Candidatus Kapabacteria bacterium]
MLEPIINFLQGANFPAIYFLLFAFLVTYIENIFPPSPSDAILLFLGTFIGIGTVSFIPMLIFSTVGSSLGFMTMFWLGRNFGHKVIEHRRLKFITPETIEKPRLWFDKYGYWVIVVNRFLSGTRAVISFIAGLSDLKYLNSIIYCTISSIVWNFIILYLGMTFSENWREVDKFLDLYGKIVMIVIIVIAVILTIRFFIKKKKATEQK